MKLQFNNLSFAGVQSPYRNSKGYKIIPISTVPSESDVKAAMTATELNNQYSSKNSRAYFYTARGENLVSKKYLRGYESLKYGSDREIAAYDELSNRGIVIKGVQQGLFAFKTPSNDTYLVSNRIQGQPADAASRPLTKANMEAIVSKLTKLDKPIPYTKKEYLEKFQKPLTSAYLPYQIVMHNDLALANVLVTDTDAGIIGFKYMELVDIDKPASRIYQDHLYEPMPDMSDVPGVVSNLRSWEYRAFIKYLKNCNPNKAKALFREYMGIKARYHREMSNIFKTESYTAADKNVASNLRNIAQKESSHAQMLTNPSDDVLKAEAMKIQLASFIYKQSPDANPATNKVNIEQIDNYLNKMSDFFREKGRTAKDPASKHYWQDCLLVLDGWSNVKTTILRQKDIPTLAEYMAYGAGPNTKENNNAMDQYDEAVLQHEIFKMKMTDRAETTLDKIVL